MIKILLVLSLCANFKMYKNLNPVLKRKIKGYKKLIKYQNEKIILLQDELNQIEYNELK